MSVEAATGKHMPADEDKFEFDAEVALVFDNMATRSIPGYKESYRVIGHLAQRLNLPKYSQVWDFGTSTAKGLQAIHSGVGLNPYLDYFGVDISEPMLEQARENAPFAHFINKNMEEGLPEQMRDGSVSVIVFGWVLQFIKDMDVREAILQQAYNSLAPGGFIAVMEKYELTNDYMNAVMQDTYIDFRRGRGYSLEEIKAKTHALQNSMWPAPPNWSAGVLTECGAEVHTLYRELNFGGIVAFKK